MKYVPLIAMLVLTAAVLVGCLADRCGARPVVDPLPNEHAPPVATIRGYIVGEFNVWGQWNNQTKVFDLVDDRVIRTNTRKLAFASDAMYREAERNDGMAVEIRAIRANREDNEWFVVISLEVLP